MKTVKPTLLALVILTLILALNSACNKNKDKEEDEDDTMEQMQQSKDETFVSNESDMNLDEVNSLLTGNVFGKMGNISGATIDDTTYISEKKIIIHYNGQNAAGTRNRVGFVTVQLINGQKWSDTGAVVKITFQSLQITNITTGKSLTFNGFHTIRNINGGRAFVDELVNHSIRGTVMVLFDNETSRSWNVARKRIIRHVDLVYTVEVRGDTAIAGLDNIVVWGVNRGGNPFYTQVQQPIIWSSLCPQGPLSGIKIHKAIKREIRAIFGVDIQGNLVSGSCPYGFKIDWNTINNTNKSAILSY